MAHLDGTARVVHGCALSLTLLAVGETVMLPQPPSSSPLKHPLKGEGGAAR